jgi:glutamate racemase
VEAGDFASDDLLQLLKHYIHPLLEANADTLVLGCTHYPFLTEAIYQVTHGKVRIVETSTPVTHQLMRILDTNNLRLNSSEKGQIAFFSSKNDTQHFQSMQTLWKVPISPQLLPKPFI